MYYSRQARIRTPTASITGLGLIAMIVCANVHAAPAEAGEQCNNKACLEQHFADCKPANYTEKVPRNGTERYRILGPVDGGCEVVYSHPSHPVSGLIGKSLTMVLDTGYPFAPQAKNALAICMNHNAPGGYQCSGSLRGMIKSGPIHDGAPRGMGEKSKRAAAAAAAGSPCGNTQGFIPSSYDDALFAMPKDGRWGYVDRSGDWIIKPEWRQAEPFSEGRAVVSVGGADGTRWGVIDRSGNYVVKPAIAPPHTAGRHASEPPIKSFSQGCAAVTPGPDGSNAHPYYITRAGKTWPHDGLPESIADLNVREFGSFSDYLAWFRIADAKHHEHYGYIDTQGNMVLPPNYAQAGDFTGSLAPAAIDDRHWAYIDPDGKRVWPDAWSLQDAHAGLWLARVTTLDGEQAYFDGAKLAIEKIRFEPPRHFKTQTGRATFSTAPIQNAGAFMYRLAPVFTAPETPDGIPKRLYYMNMRGKAVLAPRDELGLPICNAASRPQFRRELVRLRIPDKNGACDEPTPIANGQFVTHEQSHYVYIDTGGQIVLEEPFREGDTDARPSQPGADS